jgi:hypothetical protein
MDRIRAIPSKAIGVCIPNQVIVRKIFTSDHGRTKRWALIVAFSGDYSMHVCDADRYGGQNVVEEPSLLL